MILKIPPAPHKKINMNDKDRSKRVYKRLEEAMTEEYCTYEEAKAAVDKLRDVYFNRKAGNLLKNTLIQEIAKQPTGNKH